MAIFVSHWLRLVHVRYFVKTLLVLICRKSDKDQSYGVNNTQNLTWTEFFGLFVMYYIYGSIGPSLRIESTDSMIKMVSACMYVCTVVLEINVVILLYNYMK